MFCRDILISKIPLPSTSLPARAAFARTGITGCSRVISVEADRDHASFIRQCLEVGRDKDILIRGDVFRFLNHQSRSLTLSLPILIHSEGLPQIPDLVLNGDYLNEEASSF